MFGHVAAAGTRSECTQVFLFDMLVKEKKKKRRVGMELELGFFASHDRTSLGVEFGPSRFVRGAVGSESIDLAYAREGDLELAIAGQRLSLSRGAPLVSPDVSASPSSYSPTAEDMGRGAVAFLEVIPRLVPSGAVALGRLEDDIGAAFALHFANSFGYGLLVERPRASIVSLPASGSNAVMVEFYAILKWPDDSHQADVVGGALVRLADGLTLSVNARASVVGLRPSSDARQLSGELRLKTECKHSAPPRGARP
jgi:hypothetical protein